MISVGECEAYARILDKPVDTERLERLGFRTGPGSRDYAECEEYILEKPGCSRQTELSIYLYVLNDRIRGGHIVKKIITDATAAEVEAVQNILNEIT